MKTHLDPPPASDRVCIGRMVAAHWDLWGALYDGRPCSLNEAIRAVPGTGKSALVRRPRPGGGVSR